MLRSTGKQRPLVGKTFKAEGRVIPMWEEFGGCTKSMTSKRAVKIQEKHKIKYQQEKTMKKSIKKITALLSIVAIVASALAMSANAAFYHNITTVTYKSLLGTTAAVISFHSEGNSTSTSGNVTNKWFEYSANWPNYFTDMSTWNSAYPNGQKANGQYTIKAGINTSWFDLGFKSQSRTLSHVY